MPDPGDLSGRFAKWIKNGVVSNSHFDGENRAELRLKSATD